jgi:hypothetical protein
MNQGSDPPRISQLEMETILLSIVKVRAHHMNLRAACETLRFPNLACHTPDAVYKFIMACLADGAQTGWNERRLAYQTRALREEHPPAIINIDADYMRELSRHSTSEDLALFIQRHYNGQAEDLVRRIVQLQITGAQVFACDTMEAMYALLRGPPWLIALDLMDYKERKDAGHGAAFEPEEDRVWCKCGARQDDGELFICCDTCNAWSHAVCYGYRDASVVPDTFVCDNRGMH